MTENAAEADEKDMFNVDDVNEEDEEEEKSAPEPIIQKGETVDVKKLDMQTLLVKGKQKEEEDMPLAPKRAFKTDGNSNDVSFQSLSSAGKAQAPAASNSNTKKEAAAPEEKKEE